jgi:23S rRNA (guanosine2251-2'-O)-methyltransferase
MERSTRGKGKQKLLGSHQRSWVWGRRLIIEILRGRRWGIAELLLAEELDAAELAEAQALAKAQRIPVRIEPTERLRALCHSSEHQGYLAKMLEFPYADPEKALVGLTSGSQARPFHVLLDRVQDPHNFGAIIRSAEVLGVDAVWIGDRDQVGVTSMVARSSAGAVNRIPIARVPDLVALASDFRERGLARVAATEKGAVDCTDYDFTTPTVLVLGNESEGIAPEMLALCDARVRIPQAGAIGSLNVAAAAAILFYEARRQRETLSGNPG